MIFPKNISQKFEVFKKENRNNGVKDLYFDTNTKQVVVMDGKTSFTDKKSQVKQWVFLLLNTEIGKYRVYNSTEFGIYFLYEMRGKEFYTSGFTIAQIKDELKEKMLMNNNIDSVVNIEIEKGFDFLKFKIILKVDNEIVGTEVSVDV